MRTKIDEHEARLIAESLKIIVRGFNDTLAEKNQQKRFAMQAGIAAATAKQAKEILKNVFNVEVEK